MNQKNKWIVAISNTYDYSITLLHLTATVEEAKRYLLNSIEKEKEMSYEMCTRSTENIDEIYIIYLRVSQNCLLMLVSRLIV